MATANCIGGAALRQFDRKSSVETSGATTPVPASVSLNSKPSQSENALYDAIAEFHKCAALFDAIHLCTIEQEGDVLSLASIGKALADRAADLADRAAIAVARPESAGK